jgi:hypothetical protein
MSEVKFVEEESLERTKLNKQTPIARLFVKYSGGLIKTQKQIIISQLVVVIILVMIATFLMRDESKRNVIEVPEGLEYSN